ncbi:hypothetical protein [Nitrogeniibacter aestuarii]|uniref:hypothetical protein n=1 Tax=Nitrogeniibacter aestuarii TaxID=2815343 RepID=UPI001E2CF6F4|nr:hypothetical protein [Nitrogeniibacter aestuarii]
MKILFSTALFSMTIIGCATPTTRLNAQDLSALEAFEKICLEFAPSFEGSQQASRAAGINDFFEDSAVKKMGFNNGHSLGVQIELNKECVITTPESKNRTLTQRFIQTIARHATEKPALTMPTSAKLGGTTFIFLHDRSRGEAYVMLKAEKK